MAAFRYHDQSCLRYAVSHLLSMVRDGDFLIGPGHDKCRTADGGQTDPGIGTVHDRKLLADERLRAGLVRHLADYTLQREVATPRSAHPAPVENVDHLGELAVLRQRDMVTSPLCRLSCIRVSRTALKFPELCPILGDSTL
jgi:hypothetical protein